MHVKHTIPYLTEDEPLGSKHVKDTKNKLLITKMCICLLYCLIILQFAVQKTLKNEPVTFKMAG
jgi:hypothetical protein